MSSSKSSSRWIPIAVVVVLGVIAANLGAYIYFRRQAKEAKPAPAVAATTETPIDPSDIGALAEEQRQAGIKALREGRYDVAIRRLESALELAPDLADTEVLLSVARRLSSPQAAADAEPNAGAEAPAPPEREPRPVRRVSRPTRRVVRRTTPTEEEDGAVLVTTVPAGLLIEVDGEPKEISPARIELSPGSHELRLRRGPEVLDTRTIEVEAGETTSVEGSYPEPAPSAAAPRPVTGARAGRASVAGDPNLDLVELIDGDKPSAAPRPSTAPAAEAEPTASGGEIWVVLPSAAASTLGDTFGGAQVRAASSSELGGSERPAAVIAPKSMLAAKGMRPEMSATMVSGGQYLLAAFDRVPSLSSGDTVGLVDFLGRRRAGVFLTRWLGTSGLRARRVESAEDLLPLLQFSMAKAILVQPDQLEMLRERTRRELRVKSLEPSLEPLGAVIFDTSRRAQIRQSLANMSSATRLALGIESWSP